MAVERGPRTWIITGMPGAGESTVSAGLAASLPRAARVAADVVSRLITSGAVWPLGHPEDEAARQVALCHRNIGALTTNFVTAGFDTVVDFVLPDAHHLDHLVGVLPRVPTALVVLAPDGATCRARNAARPAADRTASSSTGTRRSTARCGTGSGIGVGGSTRRRSP